MAADFRDADGVAVERSVSTCSDARVREPTTGRVQDPRSAPAPGGRSPTLEPSPATTSTAPSPGPGYGVIVPDAGSDRPGCPPQSPLVARKDQGVSTPRVSPVNSLLVVDSGRVRVSEPTVSCQPVAPEFLDLDGVAVGRSVFKARM